MWAWTQLYHLVGGEQSMQTRPFLAHATRRWMPEPRTAFSSPLPGAFLCCWSFGFLLYLLSLSHYLNPIDIAFVYAGTLIKTPNSPMTKMSAFTSPLPLLIWLLFIDLRGVLNCAFCRKTSLHHFTFVVYLLHTSPQNGQREWIESGR